MSNTIFPANVRGLTYTVVKSQENSVMVKEASNFLTSRTQQNLNPRWHWSLQYEVLFDTPLNPLPSSNYSDLQTMLGFCQAKYSSFDDFLYSDPDDNFVGPGTITATWKPRYPYILDSIIIASGHAQQVISAPAGALSGYSIPSFSLVGGTTVDGGLTWQDLGASTAYPNPHAQLQVITDGTNYYSPVQRHLGGQFWEDISDLNGTITVYDNGILTSSYSLQFGSLTIAGFNSTALFLNWGTTSPVGPVTATFNFFFRVHFEDSIQDFENWAKQLWAIGGDQGSSGKGNLKFASILRPLKPQNLGPGATFPYPPFSNCGTNLMILWPQQFTFSVNGQPVHTGVTGTVYVQAGVNAWFMTQLLIQGLGSSGGIAKLFNYPDPGIARSRICNIYSYTPFTYIPWKGRPPGQLGGLASSQILANGNAMIGGLVGQSAGTFISSNGVLVGLIQGLVSISNINFSTISQQMGVGASLGGFYGDQISGNAMVLVYYT